MIDVCHYTFAQTHRVKCNASHGLEVIMMCQFRFLLVKKKVHHLTSDIDKRGGYVCVGAGGFLEILYLPLNFVINLKLL